MYHYLYRITNNVNNKIYIGARSYKGKDVKNDKYIGSGKTLHKAYTKYGILSFTKLILCFFSSKLLLYLYLSIIVDKLFIDRNDTYNLKCGGIGGLTRHTDLTKAKMIGKKMPDYIKSKISASLSGIKRPTRTELHKAKISAAKIGKKLPVFTELHKAKISKSRIGIKFTDLHKLNISLSKKGTNTYKRSELTKLKMKLSAKHRPVVSLETKLKHRLAWIKRRNKNNEIL